MSEWNDKIVDMIKYTIMVNLDDKKTKFAYYVKDKGDVKAGNHLTYKLGVGNRDYPLIRAFRFDSPNEVKRYQLDGELT